MNCDNFAKLHVSRIFLESAWRAFKAVTRLIPFSKHLWVLERNCWRYKLDHQVTRAVQPSFLGFWMKGLAVMNTRQATRAKLVRF